MNTLEHRETLWATDTKLKDRFGQKWELDAATGCWRWLGTMIPNGYGVIKPTGYLEPGLTIDHLCRNKRCVNPEHPEAVTNRINQLRSSSPVAQNAAKTHCLNGHPFDEANTYRWGGSRYCRACRDVRRRYS